MADLNINISLAEYINQLKALSGQAKSAAASSKQLEQATSKMSQNVKAATNTVTAMSAELAEMRKQYDQTSDTVTRQDMQKAMNGLKEQIVATGTATNNTLVPALTALAGSMGGGISKIAAMAGLLPQIANGFKGVQAGAVAAGAGISAMEKSSGILFAISTIIQVVTGLFSMFKDALSSNTKAAGDWEEAMSAFTPLLDGIKKVFSLLVEAISSGMKLVAPYVPKAIRCLSKAVSFITRGFYKPIVTVIGNIVGLVVKAYTQTAKIVYKGVNTIIGAAAKLAKALNLDEWAAKIDKFRNTLKDGFEFGVEMAESFANYCRNAGDAVEKMIQKTEDWAESLAAASEVSQAAAKENRKLKKEEQKLAEDSARNAARTEELKRLAVQETDKERKKAYLLEIKRMNEEEAARAKAIAKRKLQLKEEELARKGVVSKEEKAQLNELRIKYEKAGSEAANRNNEVVSRLVGLSVQGNSKLAAAIKGTSRDETDALKELKDAVVDGFDSVGGRADKLIADYKEYADRQNKIIEFGYIAGTQSVNSLLADMKEKTTDIIARTAGLADEDRGWVTDLVHDAVDNSSGGGFFDVKTFTQTAGQIIAAVKTPLSPDFEGEMTKAAAELAPRINTAFNDALMKSMLNVGADLKNSFFASIKLLLDKDDKSAAGVLGSYTNRYGDLEFQTVKELNTMTNAVHRGFVEINAFPQEIQDRINKAAEKIGIDLYGIITKEEAESKDSPLRVLDDWDKFWDDMRYKAIFSFEMIQKDLFEKQQELAQKAARGRYDRASSKSELKSSESEKNSAEKKAAEYSELVKQFESGAISIEQFSAAVEELFETADDNKVETELERAKEAYENYFAYVEELRQTNPEKEMMEENIELAKRYSAMKDAEVAAEERRANKTVKIAQKQQSKFKQVQNATIQLQQAVDQAIVTLGNMVVENQQTKIKAELEAGKITQEEAEKRFEQTKKLSVAMAVLNTLSTMPAQIYSIWSDSSIPSVYAKIALTAATVIPTTAALVAQIGQIKATTLDSSSASSSSSSISAASVSTAASTPLLDENQDVDRVQAIQGNAEQRVYILEQDIQESNKRVSVREKNSTF